MIGDAGKRVPWPRLPRVFDFPRNHAGGIRPHGRADMGAAQGDFIRGGGHGLKPGSAGEIHGRPHRFRGKPRAPGYVTPSVAGVRPHRVGVGEDETIDDADERNVFYVALTRARKASKSSPTEASQNPATL